jgi:hypothetical protein
MLLEEEEAMEFIRQKMEDEQLSMIFPIWGYILLFLGPATISFAALYLYLGLDLTLSGVIQ